MTAAYTLAVPIFAFRVEHYLNLAVLALVVFLELAALVNCLGQRADAFPLVGPLSKAAWSGILAAALVLTVLIAICSLVSTDSRVSISIFAFAGATVALLYLLDVRTALRDASQG